MLIATIEPGKAKVVPEKDPMQAIVCAVKVDDTFIFAIESALF